MVVYVGPSGSYRPQDSRTVFVVRTPIPPPLNNQNLQPGCLKAEAPPVSEQKLSRLLVGAFA